MASLNKCCFIGNMTKDPESRTTNSGTDVCSFSIAVNEKYKDKETTEYIDITAWGKLCQIICQYATRGLQVYVEGRYVTERYTDKEGNERKAVKITAERFLMLGSKGDSGNKGQSQRQVSQYEEPAFDPDESIPF